MIKLSISGVKIQDYIIIRNNLLSGRDRYNYKFNWEIPADRLYQLIYTSMMVLMQFSFLLNMD